MVSLYLASPLGFTKSTQPFRAELNNSLHGAGHTVFDPWSQSYESLELAQREPDPATRARLLRHANHNLAGQNEKAIRKCSIVLAVLDGVDVDSGTASEIGFGYGIGKTVYGLRTDTRRTGDNEGAVVNLQVEYWIRASGGDIYLSWETLLQRLAKGPLLGRRWHPLRPFLRAARIRFSL